jgi:hypothetical protein
MRSRARNIERLAICSCIISRLSGHLFPILGFQCLDDEVPPIAEGIRPAADDADPMTNGLPVVWLRLTSNEGSPMCDAAYATEGSGALFGG